MRSGCVKVWVVCFMVYFMFFGVSMVKGGCFGCLFCGVWEKCLVEVCVLWGNGIMVQQIVFLLKDGCFMVWRGCFGFYVMVCGRLCYGQEKVLLWYILCFVCYCRGYFVVEVFDGYFGKVG